MSPDEYLSSLRKLLDDYNIDEATRLVFALNRLLLETDDDFGNVIPGKLMQLLRNKRQFDLMRRLGDTLIQTGRGNATIKRQYAQALIEQSYLTAAIAVLNELEKETAGASPGTEVYKENIEARGVLGRAYKQRYIDAANPRSERNAGWLREATRYYADVYEGESKSFTWHGINAVALIKRGQADSLPMDEFRPADELATEILQTIGSRYDYQTASAWDFATAAEACIALGKDSEALQWMSGYARMPYCDAFELGSTLRQLTEVWQMDLNSETGRLLLPLLQAELLKRQGGHLAIDLADVRQLLAGNKATTLLYQGMIGGQTDRHVDMTPEKVFGQDSFATYNWMMTGMSRAVPVARIGYETTKGEGTGFLVKGSVMHESLGDELLLLTNAHVLSDNPADEAMSKEHAVISFEILDPGKSYKVQQIVWSSPKKNLDASLLRFSPADAEKLALLKDKLEIYPLMAHLPVLDSADAQRIYIIGHPGGGVIQFSMQDNLLLDHEDPRIHYRTPTAGGSSGSPVFNRQWHLIGLHRAGKKEMAFLNGKPGHYEANEGIWIQAIRKKIEEDLAGGDREPAKEQP